MSEPRLALYTREGCHLCEALLAELRPYLNGGNVRLDLVDVDDDPALSRAFGADVPVLMAEEREICRHRLDHGAVQAYLNEQSA